MNLQRARTVAALAVLLSAGRVEAQTTDLIFGNWTWRSRDTGSRPSGFGGAYVAVADGVRTATVNPAGLALIPKAEISGGTAERWGGIAISLRRSDTGTRVQGPRAESIPCSTHRPARPWAVAFFAAQGIEQTSAFDVVRAPGVGESGQLSATAEEIGLSIAKGLGPHLNVGVTGSWRHLRMDGESSVVDRTGFETSRLRLGGDANKARMIVGALGTFGPSRAPTSFRLGIAYHRDILGWAVERTVLDRAAGVVASGPEVVRIEEPPLIAAGFAWRQSDRWTISGQVDYVFYDRIEQALRDNPGNETASQFEIGDGLEPRLGIEFTTTSPIGGYLKLRAGMRRETTGRMDYLGSDVARSQAFEGGQPAFRGSVGASLLAEFYERAARLDVDMSQVVVERRSSLAAAGNRRFSLGLTFRR